MDKKKHRILRIIAFTACTSIIVPLLILPFWSFTSRWPWPELLPKGLTMRGAEEALFQSADILNVLFSSIILSMTVALLAAVIGGMTARALVFYDFKGKSFISFATILPIIIPGTAFAMGIHVVCIYLGLADSFLGVVLVHLIYALPYTINIMMDVTAMLGNGLEIQSQVLGISPLKSFYHVTLPLLMPGIISSVSMAYIISFSQYFITLMIGGGKVRTLSVVMVPFIQGGDRTIASSYALLFVLSTLVIFISLEMIIKKLTNQINGI
ncbi:ABC transporter permease [Aminipila terrae]|uniref:ABC transporter permease subunit n=1 Tax=Aminipila terrae TaxID=2697030 RepID=A0A6P1MPE5_9FIRM|nr:ABC transporter permease subunit [Aminipila terrae]QHI73546.1 ABC transporter permease subunit [Aminipila terrae]